MSENYDFVLVGGGVAGLYLAVHLGKKFRVLVLESGDKEASDDVQELSAGSVYSSYENNYFPHALPETYRFRGLGGAGNLWGGACCRYTTGETDEWLETGLDLTDYYGSVQRTLGVNLHRNAFHNSKSLFSEIDYLNNFQTDTLFILDKATDLPKQLVKKLNTKNVNVKLNHTVLKLHTSNDRVDQITCYDHLNKSFKHVKNFKKVILCSGGLETIRILKYSMENTKYYNEFIGKFYSPHINFYLPIAVFNKNIRVTPFNKKINNVETRSYISLKRKNDSRFINFKCLIDPFWKGVELNPLQEMFAQDVIKDKSRLIRYVKKSLGYNQNIYSLNFAFDQPKDFKSRIELKSETDFLGIPRLEIFHHVSDEAIRRITDTVFQLSTDLYVSRIARIPAVIDKKFLFNNSKGRSHHCGGTIISDSSDQGCCDKDCAYYGLENLDILSSSLFPNPGGINPTLTILALADRLVKRHTRGVY